MSSAKSTSDSIKECVVTEPLRPRRNPNRIGYQAVAAGKKRTAGEIEENQKRLEKLRGAEYDYICCLNSLAIPTQI
jgi:hypothetical protein